MQNKKTVLIALLRPNHSFRCFAGRRSDNLFVNCSNLTLLMTAESIAPKLTLQRLPCFFQGFAALLQSFAAQALGAVS